MHRQLRATACWHRRGGVVAGDAQHVAVALADISTIADRQPDPMASVLVGAMITIGAVAVTRSMLTHGWP